MSSVHAMTPMLQATFSNRLISWIRLAFVQVRELRFMKISTEVIEPSG